MRHTKSSLVRARKEKCTVKRFRPDCYLIITPVGHRYTVRFFNYRGFRYPKCNCVRGTRRLSCWHVLKAQFVDIALAKYFKACITKEK